MAENSLNIDTNIRFEPNRSEQGQPIPPEQAIAAPGPTSTTIKVPNVHRGESIEDPDATIIIPGTVGGKVHGRVVKVWRAQQATIKATESILIGKEVIGSTDCLSANNSVIETSPATDEITSLSAPTVTIGMPGQQASLAKELEIIANLFTAHQVSIYNPVTVLLSPDTYQRLKSVRDKPQKLRKQIKSLKVLLNEDIEDLYLRVTRPGHEHLVALMDDFFQAQLRIFENKVTVIALLRRIVNALGLRTSFEIMQRWKDRIDLEKELKQTLAELDSLKEKFSTMGLTLSIVEMRADADILIRYGDQEQRIPGPLARTTLQVTCTLAKDQATGDECCELLIDQQPW